MQTCRAIEGDVMPHDFIIGLGSNLGERGDFLAQGVTRICALPELRLRALSRVFETPPLGPPQPHYLNAAARFSAVCDGPSLLGQLQAIERALGRVREVHWGPRVLDLDILWSDQPVDTAALCVPHRHLRERTFALAPLLDVAPELTPVYGSALVALGGPPAVCGRLWVPEGTARCAWSAALVV
jgi:2-amino-4-hydroxy-6-hydroxymethyldihydropteridine diphosphokinase